MLLFRYSISLHSKDPDDPPVLVPLECGPLAVPGVSLLLEISQGHLGPDVLKIYG